MREAIGGTWITQLVIVFIFLFVAFLSLSINYSKAFKVKNEVLSFIEKNEGVSFEKTDTLGSIGYINNYLANNNYNTKGYCEINDYGQNNLSNNKILTKITTNNRKNKYFYCIKEISSSGDNFKDRKYYEVKLFFKFNLPIIGDITTFTVEGQTKDILNPVKIS